LADIVVADEDLQILSPVAEAGRKRQDPAQTAGTDGRDGERKACQDWSNRSGRTEASNCLTLEDSSGFGKSWCLNTAPAAGGAAAINGPA